MSIPYRLGLDIGTNTIGWAALRLNNHLEPEGLINGGVIVFPDGRDDKTKETSATQRRSFRSQRKRIRAKKWRRDQLRQFFITAGLIPADHNFSLRGDNDSYRPWRLRSEGLNRKLTPVELVDVLLHLHNRRGFKSNRLSLKQEKDENKQAGAGSKKAADKKDNQKPTWEQKEHDIKLLMAGANCATFGAYIFQRLTKDKEEAGKRPDKFTEAVRFRKDAAAAPPPATRSLIAQELNALRQAQLEKDGPLSAAQWDHVTALILDQRPLKAPDVGLCTFEFAAGERRAPRALPSSIRFRIQQTLCHLRKQDKKTPLAEASALTTAEFADGLRYLLHTSAPSFGGLRKALNLRAGIIFREEAQEGASARFKQHGDPVGPKLAAENLYGEEWYNFGLEKQDQIVNRLRELDEVPEKIESLSAVAFDHGGFGLTKDAGPDLVKIAWGLPDGHGDLSTKAIMKILPHLTASETYASACAKAGYDHSFAGEEIRLLKRLPYYGTILRGSTMNGTGDAKDPSEKRYGRVANVTVHVALNQLRKLMNDLIHTHGAPQQIIIETTREIAKSGIGRLETTRAQAKNAKHNERLNAELMAIGVKPTYENRRRWRLWEEQDHRCFYSGTTIGATQVCSSFCDIDHLIPRARGGFDTLDNQVLCLAEINRDKRDRTPYEAFAGGENPAVAWENFEKRLIEWQVPESKKWKCGPKASEISRDDGEGWLPRQLTDTGYAARLAHRYLRHICPQVWTTKGRITASLRHTWDLTKDRDYLSNHFIDAVVIALTDRKRVKFYNDLGRKHGVLDGKDAVRDRKLKGEPWPGFHDHVMKRADALIPSWRPDHDASGQLHEATLYSGWMDDGKGGWRRITSQTKIDGNPLIRLSKREATSSLFPAPTGKNKILTASATSEADSSIKTDDTVNGKKKTPKELARDTINSFVDPGFRHRFLQEVDQSLKNGSDFLTACRDYVRSRNIRAIERFKVGKTGQPIAAPLSDLQRITRGTGNNKHQAFIETGNNHCVDVFAVNGEWKGSILTTLAAKKIPREKDFNYKQRHVMRLHQRDLIEAEKKNFGRIIWIVRGITTMHDKAYVFLWPAVLSSGANLELVHKKYGFKTPTGWAVPVDTLRKNKAKPVSVSLTGRLITKNSQVMAGHDY